MWLLVPCLQYHFLQHYIKQTKRSGERSFESDLNQKDFGGIYLGIFINVHLCSCLYSCEQSQVHFQRERAARTPKFPKDMSVIREKNVSLYRRARETGAAGEANLPVLGQLLSTDTFLVINLCTSSRFKREILA